MDRRQRPFLRLTVWSLVGIFIFGLIEFLFIGFVNAGLGGGTGTIGGISGIGAVVSLFNFIFITLIILSVIGLLIGLVGITIRYFERHDFDLFEDDRRRRDDEDEDDRYNRNRPGRSTHK
ncbi:hypothetical protein [Aquibacillus kalidii]|uniref:hypothetical protein n=1 Tax=Aquibacillus kalidii TaxID=2762597 RepID=UPI0016479A22|nr:hypothetical protein [Aquibacillus kalidii]